MNSDIDLDSELTDSHRPGKKENDSAKQTNKSEKNGKTKGESER